METPKDFNDLMESKFVELEEAEKESAIKAFETKMAAKETEEPVPSGHGLK